MKWKRKRFGSYLEFKSQINFGFGNFGDKSKAGLSYSHISNADFGKKKSWC